MLKKLFAAALCGIAIASIADHAHAAGPGAFARGFASLEQSVVAPPASIRQGEHVDIERHKALSALDDYFQRFDQTVKTR